MMGNRMFVVQGKYPDVLLAEWDSFKAAQSPPCDDQIRPGSYISSLRRVRY
jgi:hypothetical protein